MDAVPPPIRAALALFESALADVRFADLDAKSLARAADDVHAVAAVVASAQAALDSARGALQERQDLLFEQIQRALAYARVYAENDEPLTQRLDAITLPRTGRGGRPNKEEAALVLSSAGPHPAARPRGTKRRAVSSEPMLIVDRPAGGRAATDDSASTPAPQSPRAENLER
jgi:hypothetical protein